MTPSYASSFVQSNLDSKVYVSSMYHNNATYRDVRAPAVVFSALKELTGKSAITKFMGGDVTLYTSESSFLMTVSGTSDYLGGVTGKDGQTITLWFKQQSENNIYNISGKNGYNDTVTNSTGSPIGYIPIIPTNVVKALTTLMSFDDLCSMPGLGNQIINISSSTDPRAPCPDCNPAAQVYTTSKSMDYVSGSITEAAANVQISLTYDSSGVISGSVSVSGSWDASFDTPFFSAEQIVTDTVGFNWQLNISSSMSFTASHTYVDQNTQLTYEIQITFGPYVNPCYIFFVCTSYYVVDFGMTVNIPQLS